MGEITLTSLAGYVINNVPFILEMMAYHIFYSAIAIFAAAVIGIILGILSARISRLSFLINISAVIQSAPDIVMLALMIPLLGIGPICALAALFIKGVLPIIINTYAGIKNIKPGVVESAIGMGMSRSMILFKIELPLALPVIMAGLRAASVINVSTMTLPSYIGVNGLGILIFRGIAMYEGNILIVGSILTSLLAINTNFLCGYFEKRAIKWKQ
jgi:osmoprotectant transport system permease protein